MIWRKLRWSPPCEEAFESKDMAPERFPPLLQATAPRPGLVGPRDHSAPTWSSGGDRSTTATATTRKRSGSGRRGMRDCRVQSTGNGEAMRRKSLSRFSKRSSAATGQGNYLPTPLMCWPDRPEGVFDRVQTGFWLCFFYLKKPKAQPKSLRRCLVR